MSTEKTENVASARNGWPRTGPIWFIVVPLLLAECLVIYGIYDTRDKKSSGGDIVHIASDNMPINIGDRMQILERGTYVVTRNGLVRMYWYWTYEYWYVTVPLPLVLFALLLIIRRRGKTDLSLR